MSAHNIALMGLGEQGEAYLEAICKDDRLTLTAVAESDANRRRLITNDLSTPVYEDYRSMVVESVRRGLELLVIALPPHETVEIIEQGTIRDIPILITSPPARSVDEAHRLIHRMKESHCPLLVSSMWRFEAAYKRLIDLDQLAGRVFTAFGHVFSTHTAEGWRGDRKRAGGGVLLHAGYELLDLLIDRFGPVLRVYAVCATIPRPGASQNYDTEDVTLVALTFKDDRNVSLTATRGIASLGWSLTFVGTQAAVEIKPNRLTVRRNDGRRPRYYRTSGKTAAENEIHALIALVRDPPADPMAGHQQHLDTIAAIEAAYLSARTGQPETPRNLSS